jgi:hypothetical protein
VKSAGAGVLGTFPKDACDFPADALLAFGAISRSLQHAPKIGIDFESNMRRFKLSEHIHAHEGRAALYDCRSIVTLYGQFTRYNMRAEHSCYAAKPLKTYHKKTINRDLVNSIDPPEKR